MRYVFSWIKCLYVAITFLMYVSLRRRLRKQQCARFKKIPEFRRWKLMSFLELIYSPETRIDRVTPRFPSQRLPWMEAAVVLAVISVFPLTNESYCAVTPRQRKEQERLLRPFSWWEFTPSTVSVTANFRERMKNICNICECSAALEILSCLVRLLSTVILQDLLEHLGRIILYYIFHMTLKHYYLYLLI